MVDKISIIYFDSFIFYLEGEGGREGGGGEGKINTYLLSSSSQLVLIIIVQVLIIQASHKLKATIKAS